MNEQQSARTSSTTLRPSACPGLLRIVPALDGGICRIKLAGGVITSVQASAVAEAALTYAQGVIEATNRANLQIGGIGAEHERLIESLMNAGLGPANPASDDVRNLMLSRPPGARPLAAQILEALENHPRFHELSPKFALSLDAGEALVMLEHPHDVWLSALKLDGEVWLAFGLAGCPAHDRPLAAVPLRAGEALVVALLELFLDLARPEHTRMRHLLAELSTDELLRQLSSRLSCALRVDDVVTDWQRTGHSEQSPYRHLSTGAARSGCGRRGGAAGSSDRARARYSGTTGCRSGRRHSAPDALAKPVVAQCAGRARVSGHGALAGGGPDLFGRNSRWRRS